MFDVQKHHLLADALPRALSTIAIAFALVAAIVPLSARAADAAAADHSFSGTSVTQTTAAVVGIDPASNSVTLFEENGNILNVVVDKAVGDVNKLRIGDDLTITYTRALLLRADKSASHAVRERVDTESTTPAVRGATTSVHRIQALATVQRIDRESRLVTLRGPTRTVTLQVSSDKLLDDLAPGESVRVDYVEATAVQIYREGAPLR
ncbi:hypothetical protein WKR88_14530 [Trinickia caryophylli]|uniref:Copper binding protein CusF n=1 Tax=Trinickia caryophylli TaxID=28094 RepID=A0A1X7GJM0_TRICW|nr:hypothetical protein [Trinickia caryophylli]WQE14747.1 hypothetical protein U0034_19475 [Trinickia caryophylli]GLU34944.1 hypothetical protein Busp01_47860 [Trinickia caryophylli]SMF70104.1 hypothetical protein SAMN06295900_11627 [Trinickia caryophylli]